MVLQMAETKNCCTSYFLADVSTWRRGAREVFSLMLTFFTGAGFADLSLQFMVIETIRSIDILANLAIVMADGCWF